MDTHKFSDGFKIRPDPTFDCGVSCHLASGKSPKTDNGRTVVTPCAFIFSWIFFILADKKDNYKRWMSLNFVKIQSPIMELAPLEHLIN